MCEVQKKNLVCNLLFHISLLDWVWLKRGGGTCFTRSFFVTPFQMISTVLNDSFALRFEGKSPVSVTTHPIRPKTILKS